MSESRGAGHDAARLLMSLAVAMMVGHTDAAGFTLFDAVRGGLDGPDVRLARVQLAQAEASARIAGQVLSGSARTGVQVSGASAGADPDWEARLQPFTAQATLNVVPYGPSFDAAQRAREAAADARAAVHARALQASIAAAERWWAAERAERASLTAAERVAAAERARDATTVQVAAGTAGAADIADAELALVQARLDAAAADFDRSAALVDLSLLVGTSVEGVEPRDGDAALLADAWLGDLSLPDASLLDAAAAVSERVRSAERSLADAIEAADRARRDAGPSAALSVSGTMSGAAGRVGVGAGIDTRAYQPSLELSLDPFASAPAGATASVSLSLTVPFASGRGATFERADAAAIVEAERLEQVRAQSRLELAATARAVDQASGQLRLALDRLALRELQVEAAEVRAAAGVISPLDVERSRRDLADAELALDRALDTVRLAQARLDLALDRSPFAALGFDTERQVELDALARGALEVR
jgi:outer membrane protein TolC